MLVDTCFNNIVELRKICTGAVNALLVCLFSYNTGSSWNLIPYTGTAVLQMSASEHGLFIILDDNQEVCT